MDNPKLSIAIPYKQRLENIRTVFASLADQTMDTSQFEVIVSAMEYSKEYLSACQEFTGCINIVSVMTNGAWNVWRARNLAMKQASGQVIVLLDADMALPSKLLQNMYNCYFSSHQNVCVLGQAIGYTDELTETDAHTNDVQPYSHYRKALAKLEAMDSVRLDVRFGVGPVLPWSFVWTGLVALPRATIEHHDLFFDEGFRGWGRGDQEWGYRINSTGTSILLGQDVYALHLPHSRDAAANRESSMINSRYFLAKWPSIDVELAQAVGWFEANRIYLDFERELSESVSSDDHTLGVARGISNGVEVLIVGALIERKSRILDQKLRSFFEVGSDIDVLPLVGLALPYPDKSVDTCYVLPPIMKLSTPLRDAAFLEARRVAHNVVPPVDG